MKILQIIGNLARGGAENVIFSKCTGIAAKDPSFQFRVLALFKCDDFSNKFREAGISVDCLNREEQDHVKTLVLTMRYLRHHKPDIVHTHLTGDLYGQLASFLTHTGKRISTFHNINPYRYRLDHLSRRITGYLANSIVAVSLNCRDTWVNERGMPEKKIKVIYNSPSFQVNSPIRTESYIQNKKIKCVCIGNMRPVKGHVHAIAAMQEIIKLFPKSTLQIYGADPDFYSSVLNRTIQEYGLSENVFMNGPTKNPEKIISESDIVLMPSVKEGFAIVIVEAMSLGVPVIASNIPVHKEILENGNCGLLVEAGNPSAIARAVIKLAKSPELYSQISLKGIKRADFFSREKMITEYIELYRLLKK